MNVIGCSLPWVGFCYHHVCGYQVHDKEKGNSTMIEFFYEILSNKVRMLLIGTWSSTLDATFIFWNFCSILFQSKVIAEKRILAWKFLFLMGKKKCSSTFWYNAKAIGRHAKGSVNIFCACPSSTSSKNPSYFFPLLSQTGPFSPSWTW